MAHETKEIAAKRLEIAHLAGGFFEFYNLLPEDWDGTTPLIIPRLRFDCGQLYLNKGRYATSISDLLDLLAKRGFENFCYAYRYPKCMEFEGKSVEMRHVEKINDDLTCFCVRIYNEDETATSQPYFKSKVVTEFCRLH